MRPFTVEDPRTEVDAESFGYRTWFEDIYLLDKIKPENKSECGEPLRDA